MRKFFLLSIIAAFSLIQSAVAQEACPIAVSVKKNSSSQAGISMDLSSIGLEGRIWAVLSTETSLASLQVSVNEATGITSQSSLRATGEPQILHGRMLRQHEGALVLLPVIEIWFERNFFGVQLRDFANEVRHIALVAPTGTGNYEITCPQLEWNAIDFSPTQTFDFNLERAIAEQQAFLRESTHQINIERAHLEIELESVQESYDTQTAQFEDLSRDYYLSLDANNSLTMEIARCQTERQKLSALHKKGRKSLKRARQQEDESVVYRALRKLLKGLKRIANGK